MNKEFKKLYDKIYDNGCAVLTSNDYVQLKNELDYYKLLYAKRKDGSYLVVTKEYYYKK